MSRFAYRSRYVTPKRLCLVAAMLGQLASADPQPPPSSLKNLTLEQHLDCFRKVAQGELGLEKGLSDELLSSQRVTLTPRERQVMGLVAQGLRNKEIAYTIGVTEGTIKVYLSRLFQKVGANDRLDLALFALRNMAASGTLDAPVHRAAADQPHPKPLFVTGFVSRPVERRLQ